VNEYNEEQYIWCEACVGQVGRIDDPPPPVPRTPLPDAT
jgi:hypothetical protein